MLRQRRFQCHAGGGQHETGAGHAGHADAGRQWPGQQRHEHQGQASQTQQDDPTPIQSQCLQMRAECRVHGHEGQQQGDVCAREQQDGGACQQPGHGSEAVAQMTVQGSTPGFAGEQGDERGHDGQRAACDQEHPRPVPVQGDPAGQDLAENAGNQKGGGHGTNGRGAQTGRRGLDEIGQCYRCKTGGSQPLRDTQSAQPGQ